MNNIFRYVSNIPGKKIKNKIVVIESDDWGSIRMPSLNAFERLEKKGLNLQSGDGSRYNLNDTLANKDDLSALFEVLNQHRDSQGRAACVTALTLSANPDFDKIKQYNFSVYYNEPVTDTLKKYGHAEAFRMWKAGEDEGLFIPEFHGREHLNVVAWMRSLQRGDKETLLAFEEGLWAFDSKTVSGVSFQAPYDVEYSHDIKEQADIIRDGLRMFEHLHGRKAQFFVPPNGKIHSTVENASADGGVKYISSSKIHTEVLGEGKTKKHFRYLGKKNNAGQIFLTRNAFFEPNQNINKDHVDSCLKEIEIAFKYKKPAVISTHRCNYIGGLNPSNRDHGLKELDRLLRAMLVKWPDIEFFSSAQLGDLISQK